MAMKLITIAAVVFVAQSASAASFKETYDAANILGDTISNTAMHNFLTNYDRKLTVACFEQQVDNFRQFGQKISGMLYVAGKELEEDIGVSGKKLLARIGATIYELPRTFWALIKAGEFENALQTRQYAGDYVAGYAKDFAEIVEKLEQKNPEAAKKAFETVLKVHKEASRRSKIMSYTIRDCILAERIKV